MSPDQTIQITITAVALGLALVFRFYRPRPKWKLISVKSDFTTEHHLPDVLPVPAAEEQRALAGDFSFDQAYQWIQKFVKVRRRHPMMAEFRLALKKIEFYKELAEKMGRGRWGEVDEIASRLAEVDPLDPGAALARGRAMRQMGHMASAIRFYQQALQLQPTHSLALPEFAATCRAIGQPHRFQKALDAARSQLGETHPLTIESRVQLGELVRIFADPTDPATIAHIPRDQYLRNVQARLEEMEPDLASAIPMAQSMLDDDMPELAQRVLDRCEEAFGSRAETLMLRGIVCHFEQDLTGAEASLRASLDEDDTSLARIELASVLLDRARKTRLESGQTRLRQEAQQHLRLAIDREVESLDAVSLLAESYENQGQSVVIDELHRLAQAYPKAWTPWRVLGDVHAAHSQSQQALHAYEQGLSRQQTDALLLPYLTLLGELNLNDRLLQAADHIDDILRRDAMLRWRVAQSYCEARRLGEAGKLLESVVSDEGARRRLGNGAGGIAAVG